LHRSDGPRAENGAEYYRYYYCTDREGRRILDDQMPGVRAAHGERLRGFEMDWDLPMGKRSLLLNSEFLPAARGNPETVIDPFDDITRLKETEKELQDALPMRDEFLSVASHELKTPITSIKAFAQLMKGKDEVVSNPLVARGLRSIVDQSDRLTALVNSLLDVSRLESGQLELERERIDLAELAQDVAAQVQVLSDQHPIDICAADDISLKVRGDHERLRQVLTNLLENAVKYSPEGGRVLVELRRAARNVEVAVQDSGIGIPADQRDRVLERFYRAPNASVRHYSGLGLGLHISREIVHRHGGTIRVESAEGRGAGSFSLCP
jgi:signal transduction histidine kinase